MSDIWTKEPPDASVNESWVRHGSEIKVAIKDSRGWSPWVARGWEFGPRIPSAEELAAMGWVCEAALLRDDANRRGCVQTQQERAAKYDEALLALRAIREVQG